MEYSSIEEHSEEYNPDEWSRRNSSFIWNGSLLNNLPTIAINNVTANANEDDDEEHRGSVSTMTTPTLTVNDSDIESILNDLLYNEDNFIGVGADTEEMAQVNMDTLRPSRSITQDQFNSKRKHFFILSSAGKPIYSMNGSDELVAHYMGIITTIISFFNESDDEIKTVRINETSIWFLNRAPIVVVGVTTSSVTHDAHRMPDQLNYVYLYLVSMLTKPFIEKNFKNKANFNLRKFLNKSDLANLDHLCWSMSIGQPGFLIGGLECLKMNKKVRTQLNGILLDAKKSSPDLLYGLLVAPTGKLVTILRPKRHTLHTVDLQLLFSMVFNMAETDNNEEFWIPVCLPKFNPNGFLYAFINFVQLDNYITSDSKNGQFAMILLSANKNSFFDMQKLSHEIMKKLVSEFVVIDLNTALLNGRVSIMKDIKSPIISHFIYKSKKNLQYVCSRTESFKEEQLFNLYGRLHEELYGDGGGDEEEKRLAYIKWRFKSSLTGLAIANANFEVYCVASGFITKDVLIQSCKKIIRWCEKNEERLFVCGGAMW